MLLVSICWDIHNRFLNRTFSYSGVPRGVFERFGINLVINIFLVSNSDNYGSYHTVVALNVNSLICYNALYATRGWDTFARLASRTDIEVILVALTPAFVAILALLTLRNCSFSFSVSSFSLFFSRMFAQTFRQYDCRVWHVLQWLCSSILSTFQLRIPFTCAKSVEPLQRWGVV